MQVVAAAAAAALPCVRSVLGRASRAEWSCRGWLGRIFDGVERLPKLFTSHVVKWPGWIVDVVCWFG